MNRWNNILRYLEHSCKNDWFYFNLHKRRHVVYEECGDSLLDIEYVANMGHTSTLAEHVNSVHVFTCSRVHVFTCSRVHVFICSCTLGFLNFPNNLSWVCNNSNAAKRIFLKTQVGAIMESGGDLTFIQTSVGQIETSMYCILTYVCLMSATRCRRETCSAFTVDWTVTAVGRSTTAEPPHGCSTSTPDASSPLTPPLPVVATRAAENTNGFTNAIRHLLTLICIYI